MQIPWRRAYRAARSSPLTLVVATTTALLLSFVVTAAILHASAAGSAATTYQASQLCPHSLGPTLEGTHLTAAQADQVVRLANTTDTHGFTAPVAAVYSRVQRLDFNGVTPWARLGYRDGALDHLTVLAGGGRDGLWVPRSIAEDAGIHLGDRGLGGQLPPVTAIYQDISNPTPDWWCSEAPRILPNVLAGEGATAAVIWAPDAATFAALPTSAIGVDTTVTLHYPPATAPATLQQAQDLLSRGGALLDEVSARLDAAGLRGVVSPALYFTRPTEVAAQVRDSVATAITPLAALSALVGLAGLATVALQWCQRRHTELRLLWSRGAGPLALAGRALLELAVPQVVGAALGLLAARALLGVYAPAPLPNAGALALAAAGALAVALLALLVTGVVVALRSHRVLQDGPRGARTSFLRRLPRLIPWELLTAALAVPAWISLTDLPFSVSADRPSLRVEPAALAFPLLLVLTVALLTARLLRLALRASHRAALWSRPAAHLALRRLAAAAGPVAGVVLVATLAIGTLAAGTGLASAQRTALDSKSGMLVGARSSVQVDATWAGQPGQQLPESLRASSTLVGVSKTSSGTVLVVDPATLTRGAYLDGPVDAATVTGLLDQLTPTGGAPIPAVAIGAAATGELRLAALPTVRTIATLPAFPRLGTARGYLLARAGLPDLTQVDTWHVWSTTDLTTLTGALDAAGIQHITAQSAASALDGLPFFTIQWSFGFVTALGAVLALASAVALVLTVEVRRRQAALSGALASRMGLRPAALVRSHLLELGAVGAAAVLAGCLVGVGGVTLAAGYLDPAPWLSPRPTPPNLFTLVAGTALVAGLVVVLAGGIAVRSVRTAQIGELIRD